ncbi:MAG: hypothetical protein NC548_64225, partial [Lachnospiraceae bacterium]|nr:hypothetical protein [Lachnospiraceae bacterium]
MQHPLNPLNPLEPSDTYICHNLRPVRGDLFGVGAPALTAQLGHTPVFSDVLNAEKWFFAQEDDGSVIAVPLNSLVPLTLGRVEEKIVEGASVGDFVILRLKNGKLIYIARNAALNSYQWLGEMPKLPSFSISIEQGVAFSQRVEPVTFPKPLSVPENPVSEQIADKVWAAWLNAFYALRSQIHNAGKWCEPVIVKIALRLWDDTLLHVSDPIRISPPKRPGADRFSVGLIYDSAKKVFTGTDSATISASGYSFSVSIDNSIPSQWEHIIKGVEIWVSKEPSPLNDSNVPAMAFFAGNNGNSLSFMPSLHPDSLLNAIIPHLYYGLTDFWPLEKTSGSLFFDAQTVFDSAVNDAMLAMPAFIGQADCILGYGGFLHIGSGNDLYTSERGNPLVLKSSTAGVGSHIRSIIPQITGGGAFTRQYIYLSTDRGIVALTHDPKGVHTNSRPVCRETLS